MYICVLCILYCNHICIHVYYVYMYIILLYTFVHRLVSVLHMMRICHWLKSSVNFEPVILNIAKLDDRQSAERNTCMTERHL